tara:strand:- start:2396 stop:3610 length:1215 start_codon:yes stop_codon:yes gene_type:complete
MAIKGDEPSVHTHQLPEMNNALSDARSTTDWLCTTLNALNTKCNEQAVALKAKDDLIAMQHAQIRKHDELLSAAATNAQSALVAAKRETELVQRNFDQFIKENERTSECAKGESQRDCLNCKDAYANSAVSHVDGAVAFTATCRQAPTIEGVVTKTTKKLTRAEGGTGGRRRGKTRVATDTESSISDRDLSTVPFFKSLGVATAAQLQCVLSDWYNDKKGRLIDAQQLKTAYHQCKYKAEKFIRLVYFTGQDKYTPGDVDALFEFFNDKTHADMCEDGNIFNHDHRVCKWFYFKTVDSYKSFRHEDNVYQARQARGFMTAVRSVYELYKIHTNKTDWPNWRAEREILKPHQTPGAAVKQLTATPPHTPPLLLKRKRHSNAHMDSDSDSDSDSGSDVDCMPQMEV